MGVTRCLSQNLQNLRMMRKFMTTKQDNPHSRQQPVELIPFMLKSVLGQPLSVEWLNLSSEAESEQNQSSIRVDRARTESADFLGFF